MTDRYRFDAAKSSVTVKGYATGLLSFAAHDPTFAVSDFSGEIWFQDPLPSDGGLKLAIRADSLELVGQTRDADRREIESRMRQEVLETAQYPEVLFETHALTTKSLGEYRYRVDIKGRFTLHGITQDQSLAAELEQYADGVRMTGSFPLRLSEFRIKPVTALGGAIRLRDELQLAFDLVAWKQ